MTGRRWRAAFCALAGFVFVLCAAPGWAGEAVRVENATHASSCAEDDNVYVRFIAAGITRFTIEARHPAYLATVSTDSTAPDFGTCDQSHDSVYNFAPLDLTLYEDAEYRLVGHRFSRFWRPENVDFKVGNVVTHGLHLVQLIRKRPARDIEILVVYPSDGYWRIKPLPPPGLADTAYGSSFLVGPIQQDGRPYVPLSSIEFDRSNLSFRLSLRTGTGTVRVAEASSDRTRVEVTLPASPEPIAFAALRSMYVSRQKADTAEVVLDRGAGPSAPLPVAEFPSTDAIAATFARSTPSTHNTSAPDFSFGAFARQ